MSKSRCSTPAQVVVALVVLGVLVSTLLLAPQRWRPSARAQSANGDELLRTLAERLLSSTYPNSIPPSAPLPFSSSVQLLPGSLPSDLPIAIPMPPGSTLIGSALRPSFTPIFSASSPATSPAAAPPGGQHVDIVVDATGAAADIVGFYTNAMTGMGWTSPASPSVGSAGFQTSTQQATSAIFCQRQTGPSLAISARLTGTGALDLRLTIETNSGIPTGCGAPVPPPSLAGAGLGLGLLPRLTAPAGVTVQQDAGSGRGPYRFSSDAVASTDTAIPNLEGLYEQQLVSDGWTRVGGGSTGALSWSTWSIPDSGDWQGFLYVREGPEDAQRTLHVEVASAPPAGSSFGYYPANIVTPFPQPGAVAGASPAPTATPARLNP